MRAHGGPDRKIFAAIFSPARVLLVSRQPTEFRF
jgi:hypothetical protein